MRGELPVAADGLLIRPVAGVGVNNACSTLNVGDNDPVGLNEVVANQASDSDHVGAEAVPDVGACGFEDSFKISSEGTIDIGAGAPRVGGVEHPTEADVVLFVVIYGGGGTQTAGREHGACHKLKRNTVFDKDFGNGVTRPGIGHRGETSRGIGRVEVSFGNRGGTALLHLGKKRQSRCE